MTRLGKNAGLGQLGQSSLVGTGSLREGATSPTPHFPLPVCSFPLKSPQGVGTLLSCVEFSVWICVQMWVAGAHGSLDAIPPNMQDSGAEGWVLSLH